MPTLEELVQAAQARRDALDAKDAEQRRQRSQPQIEQLRAFVERVFSAELVAALDLVYDATNTDQAIALFTYRGHQMRLWHQTRAWSGWPNRERVQGEYLVFAAQNSLSDYHELNTLLRPDLEQRFLLLLAREYT